MKNRIVRSAIYTVLSLLVLYTGISCIATLHKANTQPYLVSGTARFDFMGYYMMAMLNGAVCIAAAFALAFFIVRMKKSKSKHMKP